MRHAWAALLTWNIVQVINFDKLNIINGVAEKPNRVSTTKKPKNKMKKTLLFLILNCQFLIQNSFAQTIAGGYYHSLAICCDSTARAWGSNYFGELGNGNNTDSNVPVQVSGLTGDAALATGYAHSLALKNDGTVRAWGRNNIGQLGNGTYTDSNVPVQVSSLTGITAIAGGSSHSLALLNDGTVRTWGWNIAGQLGNGNNTDSNVPVQVSALSGITAIAGGNSHSLALKNDGTVWAWGDNNYGQLGNGNNTGSNAPVQVSALSGIIAIAGGGFHSLALKNDGTVWAWGDNNYGQLGNGTNTGSNVPVQVSALSGITAIARGNEHSLALKNDGTVWAWGRNNFGQLGNGTTTDSNVPVQVSALSGITAIAGGGLHSLALKNDGTVRAWGANNLGQLGNGTNINSNVPVQVTGQCQMPIAVITAGGPTAFCASGSVTLNANTGTGLTYQWRLNGNNISGATTTTYVATSAGSYTVIVTNSCGSVTSNQIDVIVNPLPSVSFSGLAASYSVTSPSVTLTGSPTGGTFSGPGISGNTFDPAAAGLGGPYTIAYSYTDGNGCSNSSAQQTTVTSCTVPAKPGSISTIGGTAKVCPGDTKSYKITAVSGATSYTWTPPAGGVITNGQGTVQVTVNYTASFTASDTLRVVANNSCGSSAQRTLKITRNTPATPSVITGQSYGVCNLTGVPYSVTSVAGITYNWTINVTTANITTGQGTNTITADFNAGYVTGSLKVSASNACGTSALRSLTVKTTPATPASITGATSVCVNQQNVSYSISVIPFVTNYTWVGPSGSHISDGVTTSAGATLITTATSVTVNYGSTAGTLKARGNNSCGSGSYKSITITFGCKESESESESEMAFDAQVYPNPSSGNFIITLTNVINKGEVEIFNVYGAKVFSENISHTSNAKIHLKNIPKGIYFVRVFDGEKYYCKKIIIEQD